MAHITCGSHPRLSVDDYCAYRAADRAQLRRCLDRTAPNDLRGVDTNAGRCGRGELDRCLSDAGPFCKRAVEIGDLDGAGRPDLVIGASAVTESTGPAGSAHAASQCFAAAPGGFCVAQGRAYIYRGEEIVGTSPTQVLDGTGAGETVRELKAPDAQADGSSGLFANSLTPIGDVGSCTNTGLAPGALCPEASSTNVPDGRPDVVIGALRVDLPVNSPGGATIDEGAAYLMDGATGTILRRYDHPEPEGTAIFGSQVHNPPTGDVGDTALPDAFIPAGSQDVGAFSNAGKGYILNGNFKAPNLLIREILDPTPLASGSFGSSSVGVGNLVGGAAAPKNEILVGAGGSLNPATNNDIHFFNGPTGAVLQSISDPGGQPGSRFGANVTGLADLNDDGYLDFAASAPSYNNPGGSGEGRLYIFRSVRPAAPPPPQSQQPPVSGCAAGTSAGVSCVRNAQGGLTITGTSGANRIVGTSGRDVIRCGDGDDVVFAGPGDDEIRCGAGNDTIEAGTGNDLADGESGNDRIDGDPGNDRLIGGTGNDTINGGSGDEVVRRHGQRHAQR